MEEMTANSLIMNAPQKPRRSSEHLLALRRQSLGELDFELKSENIIRTSTMSQFPTTAELDENQEFPTLFKPNFHQSPEDKPLRFDLEPSWEEEEEDAGKEEAKQELSRNLLLDAPKKGKHSAVARFALRKQLQEEALLEEDNFYRKRKFTSFLGEEGVEGEEKEEEVAEEDHFCRKRKFTLEEEDEEAKGETLELKTLPLKKRVRFNLNSLFRKNLEDFVNEKKMEELENGMKQL